MGTVDPQHHSHVGILGPSPWQDCFPFIPHPANNVPKGCFLGDVIEARRDRHVQDWARLGKEEVESRAGDVAQRLTICAIRAEDLSLTSRIHGVGENCLLQVVL